MRLSAGDRPAVGSSRRMQPRRAGEGERDLELALLAMGEVPHRRVALGREAHRLQHGERALGDLRVAAHGPVHVVLHGRQRLRGEQAVVQHGQAREQVGDLVRAREPERGPPVRRQPRHVAAEERDGPRARALLAADEAEERGLPRPVGADDGAALPRPHRQRDAVHRAEAAELHHQPGQRQRDGRGVAHAAISSACTAGCSGRRRAASGTPRGCTSRTGRPPGYVWITVFQSSPSFFSTLRT